MPQNDDIEFERDWQFQLTYAQLAMAIIGASKVEAGSLHVDMHQATDFVVISDGKNNFACRLRRPQQLRFRDQFTIRTSRPSGVRTEHHKIIEDGFGQYFLYGFVTSEREIKPWYIIDLTAFRFHLKNNPDKIVISHHENRDHTEFDAYMIASFPIDPPILLDSSDEQLIMRLKPMPPLRFCSVPLSFRDGSPIYLDEHGRDCTLIQVLAGRPLLEVKLTRKKCGNPVPPYRVDALLCDEHYAPASDQAIVAWIENDRLRL